MVVVKVGLQLGSGVGKGGDRHTQQMTHEWEVATRYTLTCRGSYAAAERIGVIHAPASSPSCCSVLNLPHLVG